MQVDVSPCSPVSGRVYRSCCSSVWILTPVLDGIEFQCSTWIVGLPFMYSALFRSQQARARKVDSLRACLVAGDVCPLQLQEEFSSAFGVPLRSVWATTEAVACLTYGWEMGPVSRAVNGTEVRLVN